MKSQVVEAMEYIHNYSSEILIVLKTYKNTNLNLEKKLQYGVKDKNTLHSSLLKKWNTTKKVDVKTKI